jgi:hypothetical protein
MVGQQSRRRFLGLTAGLGVRGLTGTSTAGADDPDEDEAVREFVADIEGSRTTKGVGSLPAPTNVTTTRSTSYKTMNSPSRSQRRPVPTASRPAISNRAERSTPADCIVEGGSATVRD